MPVSVICPCGKKLKAKDEAAGRTGKCPACGKSVTFPALDEPYDFSASEFDRVENAPLGLGNVSVKKPEASAPPPLPTSDWFYSREGNRHGPIGFQQLVSLPDLKPNDMAWKAGMTEWMPVSSLPEFSQRFGPPPALPTIKEQTFFAKGGVTITSARFIAKGQTYAVNGITSVMLRATRPVVGPLFMIFLGLPFALLGGLGVAVSFSSSELVSGLLSAVGTTFGLVLIGLGIKLQNKILYQVVLTTAAGQQQALDSNDGPFMKDIIQALNDAIASR